MKKAVILTIILLLSLSIGYSSFSANIVSSNFTETDTLQSVTDRGASTNVQSTFTGGIKANTLRPTSIIPNTITFQNYDGTVPLMSLSESATTVHEDFYIEGFVDATGNITGNSIIAKNEFVITNSSGSPTAFFRPRTTTGTELKLTSSNRPTGGGIIFTEPDPRFTAGESLYIGASNFGGGGRIYFGGVNAAGAKTTLFSIDFNNVHNWENVPAFISQKVSTSPTYLEPGRSGNIIGQTLGNDMVLTPGLATGFITNPQGSTLQAGLFFRSYNYDGRLYSDIRPQAYQFDTRYGANNLTAIAHTRWQTAGVDVMTLNSTGNLTLNGTIKAFSFIGNGSLLTGLPSPNLTGYVPYTGATADINLNTYDLKATDLEATGKLITPNQIQMTDSINIGDSNTVGLFSVGVGYFNAVTGISSTGVGLFTEAWGDTSTAIGIGSKSHGTSSVAIGSFAEASKESSVAIGDNTQVYGTRSISLGTATRTYSDRSITIGYGLGAGVNNNHNMSVLFGLTNSTSGITSRTNESFLFTINTNGTQQDLLHAESNKGVRIGAYAGETVNMTGTDLYVAGHIEAKDGYYSGDGTQGATGIINLTTVTSIEIKDGLIVGWS